MESKRVRVMSPDGKVGTIPEEQVAAAVGQGYKLADAGSAATPAAPSTPSAPTADPAASSDDPSMLSSAMSAVPGILAGVGRGAVKGVTDMAVGAGDLVHRIPGVSTAVDTLYGTPGLSKTAMSEAHKELAPVSTSEAVGKTGVDLASMLIPGAGESVPARLAAQIATTGAQTQGDPTSMAISGGMGAAGEAASPIISRIARMVRSGPAEQVAATRTADLAKRGLKGLERKNAMNDPLWMEAQAKNADNFTDLIKQYGLTGDAAADAATIAKAPAQKQEVLSALSRQMNPAGKSLGHEWSVASGIAGLAGLATGGPEGAIAGGGGVGALLLLRSLMKKYPGQSAQLLDRASTAAPWIARLLGGGVGLGFQDDKDQ